MQVYMECHKEGKEFLFLVINVLNFQPNNFDNYKLFIYGWLVFSILIGSLVSNLLSGRYYSKLLAICVIIGLISPGILSVSRLLNASYLLVNTEEVEFAKQVADVVPRDQVILTTSSHNNPISMFSGRRIVMGYPGWLSSYGKDINSLAWIGIDSINLLKADQFMRKNAIKYIAVHNLNEVNQLNSSNYKLLIRSSSWSLYQITF